MRLHAMALLTSGAASRAFLGFMPGRGETIEAGGAEFAAVGRERHWKIPTASPGVGGSDLGLALRVWNRQDQPMRFNGFCTLQRQLLTGDRALLDTAGSENLVVERSRLPSEIDFPLLMPGEHVDIAIWACLF